jgi:hypothetical protein
LQIVLLDYSPDPLNYATFYFSSVGEWADTTSSPLGATLVDRKQLRQQLGTQ